MIDFVFRGVYDKCCGDRDGFRGRCTAPLFIDKKEMRIVSNESGKIVRNLISISFDGERGVDLRPNALEERIDKLNASVCRQDPFVDRFRSDLRSCQ